MRSGWQNGFAIPPHEWPLGSEKDRSVFND